MDEIVSVDSIVTNLNTAIENEDDEKITYWHSYLYILSQTDWSFFNHNQRTQYENFNFFLPLPQKTGETIKKDIEEKKAITAALIEKLNQDKCTIDWTMLLGSNIKTTHSPEELKQLRIKTLQESHIPKPHSSN
jgi:hypothetical protein